MIFLAFAKALSETEELRNLSSQPYAPKIGSDSIPLEKLPELLRAEVFRCFKQFAMFVLVASSKVIFQLKLETCASSLGWFVDV